MSVRTPSVADLTGSKAAELRKAQEQDAADRSLEISMATAQAARDLDNTILDITVSPDAPTLVDEVTFLTDPDEDKVLIRVAEDMDEVTIGDFPTTDFKAGQQYLVPPNVEFVLRTAGRLYLRG